MTSPTTKPNEEELDQLIERRIKIASTETKSTDPVVQIAWLADGIDVWHLSKGKRGNSPAKARRYIISSVSRYVEQAQREMLDELEEAVAPNSDNATKQDFVNRSRYVAEKTYDFIEAQRAKLRGGEK